MPAPTHLYIGRREVVIAELGGSTGLYPGRYLIAPYGDDTYDCDGADTRKDAEALLREAVRAFPSATVVRL